VKLIPLFFFSAAVHSFDGMFAEREELGEFRLFILQAAAIIAEDSVIWVTKSRGWKKELGRECLGISG
jgi:hypothetical protein